MDVAFETCSLDCPGNKAHLLGEEGPADLTVFLIETKVSSDRFCCFERGMRLSVAFIWRELCYSKQY